MHWHLLHEDSIWTVEGRARHHVALWLAVVAVVVAAAVIDTTVVVWSANIGGTPLIAGSIAFLAVIGGVIYTAWHMEGMSR